MSEESLDYRAQLANIEEAKAEFNKAYEEATKTGDPVKAEELQALLEKKLSILEKALSVAEKPERASFEEAQEIMGSDFIGPDDVEAALGVENGISKIEAYENKIPYSREDLEKANKLDAVLIYRAGQIGNGPVTLDYLSYLYLNKYGVALVSNKTEVETAMESPIDDSELTSGWKLVKKNPIDSGDGNYMMQTSKLYEFLLANSLASKEILERTGKLYRDYDLSHAFFKLEINLKHRRSPLEAIYDWVIMPWLGQVSGNGHAELTNKIIEKNGYMKGISIRSDQNVSVVVGQDILNVEEILSAKTYPTW